jgi:hypothetical protein
MLRRQPTYQEQAGIAFPFTNPAQIAGRDWTPRGDGVYVRAVPPNQEAPKEAHAVTPHPHRARWRIAWVFFALMSCTVSLLLALVVAG